MMSYGIFTSKHFFPKSLKKSYLTRKKHHLLGGGALGIVKDYKFSNFFFKK